MRIASIILPKVGNAGESLDVAHTYVKRALCRAFNGYTALDSFGGWVSDSGELYEEAGITYRTSCEDSDATRETLRHIARHAGALASQLAMFVEMPDGSAEILDTSNNGKESANA